MLSEIWTKFFVKIMILMSFKTLSVKDKFYSFIITIDIIYITMNFFIWDCFTENIVKYLKNSTEVSSSDVQVAIAL